MTINRCKLFKDAWAYAKAFAAFDGRSPRTLIADALRKCWAEAKALAVKACRPAVHVSDDFWSRPAFVSAVAARQNRLGDFSASAW